MRTSFVNEYEDDGKIIIKFVKSEYNEAEIFAKNTTNTIFQSHQMKLVWDKGKVSRKKAKSLPKMKSNTIGVETKSDKDRQTDSRSEV